MSRRTSRTDGNHAAIASCFLACGCSVQSLAEVGFGCPDLLIGINTWNVLVEVKDPTQQPNKRRLNSYQKKWHAEWRGRAHIIETPEQAAQLVKMYRERRT